MISTGRQAEAGGGRPVNVHVWAARRPQSSWSENSRAARRRATAQAWTSTSTRIDLALRAYLSAASAMQSCKPAVKSPSWVYGLVHWVVTARDFANRMDGRAVAERPAWLVTASSWGRITCSRLVPFTDDLTNR